MSAYAVAALYRFVRLPEPATLVEPLKKLMLEHGVVGTLLLAEEGINGTVAGSPEALRRFVDRLRQGPTLASKLTELDVKWSTADEAPFRRVRVRVKEEIVTLGRPEINPGTGEADAVGQYVEAEDWNDLLEDPELTLIDTRNDYEVQIGTFESAAGPAVNPQTQTFRQLPDYVDRHLDPRRHPKVAMFCTGGIRCEKSTALLKARGFGQVFHLRGGILKYLETVPEAESKFWGACFVFDRRVAVSHGLAETDYELCFACGWPTTSGDRRQPTYRPGISCPRCHGRHRPEQVARFEMRQKQHAKIAE
jgi:UPF0176 protein